MNMQEEETGVVFGFMCTGHVRQYTVEKRIFRFGRSKRVLHQLGYNECRELAVERLGHRGLNRPEAVMFWFETTDVDKAWEVVVDLLRFNCYVSTETSRPESIVSQYEIGDNFYSVTGATYTDFGKWLDQSAEKLLHEIKRDREGAEE